LTAHHDGKFRELVDRLRRKWSLLVCAMLDDRPTRRARFSELQRSIGVSQAMLIATLRSLERDGLVTRDVYAEVPPRVEYALTPLGQQFMRPVRDLAALLEVNWASVTAARETFDRRSPWRGRIRARTRLVDGASKRAERVFHPQNERKTTTCT
jgi:DNA-binding HxlR family transcriptional regulator